MYSKAAFSRKKCAYNWLASLYVSRALRFQIFASGPKSIFTETIHRHNENSHIKLSCLFACRRISSVNNHCFPKQRQPISLCRGAGICSLWHKTWPFIYNLKDTFQYHSTNAPYSAASSSYSYQRTSSRSLETLSMLFQIKVWVF
jgi:hypothetical protein